MRLTAILLISLAALAASASISRAEDGCGDGWYWNGYNCAPMHRYERWHRDEHRDDDWRRREWWRQHHRYRDGDEYDHGPQFYGNGSGYQPPSARWHTWNGCPPNFTVQDGLCKPYQGPGYYRPNRRKWHTFNGCQPHYTVQGGFCKPYRGY